MPVVDAADDEPVKIRELTAPSLVDNITKDLRLSNDTYREVVDTLEREFNLGLNSDTNKHAAVKMFPTYVRAIPDGSEEGNFLALDLGGTNFRVLLICLKGQKVEMKSRIYPISQDIMQGPGHQLFDHIAECIAKFMEEHNLKEMNLPLGFTFSFPCKQKGLSRAILVKWTKGFKCEGVEGEDIVRLLHEAIERRQDINVRCLAVINDTVGTLMACAHSDKNCQVGLILGTGTNACYMEDIAKVDTWDSDTDEPKQVVVNTEWGAFGDNGALDFVRTEYDHIIDQNSINPGKQVFEKMISGMYMGELVRLMLVKLIKERVILGGVMTMEMEERERFYTKYVSEIEDDNDEEFTNTVHVFGEMGYERISPEDCRTVQHICSLVSTRAAYLSSAGLATILKRINKPDVTVAIDGSLYRFHPHFHDLMDQKLAQLLPHQKFKLMLSSDGSGKGAALVAAVAYRMMMKNLGTPGVCN